jgi:hypothetical protein
MDLETFVAETIKQIVSGVKAAQKSEECEGATVNPREAFTSLSRGKMEGVPMAREITFDVALMVVEGSEKKAGLTVWGIGGGLSANSSNTSVSRIGFSVPVILPAPKRG